MQVREGDQLDFVLRASEENPSLLVVKRAIILKFYHQKSSKTRTMEAKIRFWPELLVPEADLKT